MRTPCGYYSIHNMDSSIDIIDRLFGGHGRTAILRLLAEQATPLTGRQIAGLTGLSHAGANRALEHFASLGVVRRIPVGSACLHELDRANEVVARVVLPTIEAERLIANAHAAAVDTGVPPEVLECLVERFDPLKIMLFGSRVNGTADEASDFDLLVVLPELTDKHATMVAMLLALGRFGVPVDVIPTDPSEIARIGTNPGTVLADALSSGRVLYERAS